jgi:predicted NAD-dependent protein-ADP-ribosyltransferase YbiA (DUF1768 family)
MNEKELYDYLVREERYDSSRQDCYGFSKGGDMRKGRSLAVGNMVGGFPFTMEGVRFNNSECAYIAGLFSDGEPESIAIQRRLADCSNGLMAKRGIRKPNEKKMRKDFFLFNIEWMLYVVWCKCVGNADFRRLLLAFPENSVILEDVSSHPRSTGNIWGCCNDLLKGRLKAKKNELKNQGVGKTEIDRRLDALRLGEWSREGEFVGQNIMGKVLMVCRDALRAGTTPAIDLELLRNARINFFGTVLPFMEVPTVGAAPERRDAQQSSFNEPSEKPLPESFPKLSPGQRVRHAAFGEGTVIETSGDGSRVTVDFGGKPKTLSLRYAKLEAFGL